MQFKSEHLCVSFLNVQNMTWVTLLEISLLSALQPGENRQFAVPSLKIITLNRSANLKKEKKKTLCSTQMLVYNLTLKPVLYGLYQAKQNTSVLTEDHANSPPISTLKPK